MSPRAPIQKLGGGGERERRERERRGRGRGREEGGMEEKK